MTKDYFIELAGYNCWANAIVHSWLEKIIDEQWLRPIVSSFPSIEATVIHVAGAESIWLQRLNNVETDKQVWLPSSFKGLRKDAIKAWRQSSEGVEAFIKDFDETKLRADLDFKRLNGDAYTMPYYQVLAHIFNHSTYHRGQLVTMLRQVGFTEISSTDLLQYFRK